MHSAVEVIEFQQELDDLQQELSKLMINNHELTGFCDSLYEDNLKEFPQLNKELREINKLLEERRLRYGPW